jgi:hypothetical protein
MPLEEIQQTSSQALGRAHGMTATPDCTLKIGRMPLMTAKVNLKWDGERTTLQARERRLCARQLTRQGVGSFGFGGLRVSGRAARMHGSACRTKTARQASAGAANVGFSAAEWGDRA